MSIYFDYLDAFENRCVDFEDCLFSPRDEPRPGPVACCHCKGVAEWRPCEDGAFVLHLIKWAGSPRAICSTCEVAMVKTQDAHERTFPDVA